VSFQSLLIVLSSYGFEGVGGVMGNILSQGFPPAPSFTERELWDLKDKVNNASYLITSF